MHRVHRLREHGDGDERTDPRVGQRGPYDDVGGHRMADQRDGADPAGFRQRHCHDPVGLLDEPLRRPVDCRHVALHWDGIAPMSLEVESDDTIAGARQRQRIGLHHLPRARKSMCYHHQRAITPGMRVERRRRLPGQQRFALHAGTIAFEKGKRGGDHRERHCHPDQASKRLHRHQTCALSSLCHSGRYQNSHMAPILGISLLLPVPRGIC